MKDKIKNIKGNAAKILRLLISVISCFLFMAIILSSCDSTQKNERILPFVIQISENDSTYYDHFLLDWENVEERIGSLYLVNYAITVTDLNNDKIYIPDIIDSDGDNIPNCIKVSLHLGTEEPLRPFKLSIRKKQKNKIQLKQVICNPSNGLSVVFLSKYDREIVREYHEGSWVNAIAETFTAKYDDPAYLEIFSPGEWTYTNGFFLNALCYYDQLSGQDKYWAYVQQWLDLFVSDEGYIDTLKYSREKYRLDDVLPGRSLLYVYKKTRDEKYLKAINELLDQLKQQPRTSEGGYWHKKIYDWQMWLDGIYMSDVFMLQYAELFNKPNYSDEAIFQMQLIYKHTLDTVTGLLYHGWDESRSKIWADPQAGTSPEFWGRGMGWYMMALVDALDYIPESHPERENILEILRQLSNALIKYQDQDSGMWYQVIDKVDAEGNWPETSCTAMFAYALLKAYKKGYLPESFKSVAEKAYEGLKKQYVYFDDEGNIYLTGTVKVGTLNVEVSNGSYEYYTSVDRRANDFKGIAALLYLAIVDEYMEKVNLNSDEL